MKKKLLILLVLCCGLLLVGCNNKTSDKKDNKNKKETTEKENKNLLVGKWEYETGGFIYTFNEDKTGSYDTGGQKLEFTYKTEGDKLYITYTDTEGTFDTTYKIKGNVLVIKDSLNEDVKYLKK